MDSFVSEQISIREQRAAAATLDLINYDVSVQLQAAISSLG